MSAKVSVRFSANDCAGAPKALLWGGLYDGSVIELHDAGKQEHIHISVHGMEQTYQKTEATIYGKVIYEAL